MGKQVTFSIEALEALVRDVAKKEGLVIGAKGRVAKAVDHNGKTERQIENEKATIKAFKKAGFGLVVPHEDVKTFNRWLAVGMRPVEGTKSVKARGMSLFHKTQVRPLTSEEKRALTEANAKAVADHAAKQIPGVKDLMNVQ